MKAKKKYVKRRKSDEQFADLQNDVNSLTRKEIIIISFSFILIYLSLRSMIEDMFMAIVAYECILAIATWVIIHFRRKYILRYVICDDRQVFENIYLNDVNANRFNSLSNKATSQILQSDSNKNYYLTIESVYSSNDNSSQCIVFLNECD